MKNIQIIKNITSSTSKIRKSIQRLASKHSEAQCNGDYYFEEDKNKWTSTTGKNAEAKIINDINYICGTKNVPNFISYSNDPRGIVIKIESSKLTAEDIELCNELNLYMDWSGDYSILTNAEFKELYNCNI